LSLSSDLLVFTKFAFKWVNLCRYAEGAKDDMEGKSLREALSDAWNGRAVHVDSP
jgi:hypothetical protein